MTGRKAEMTMRMKNWTPLVVTCVVTALSLTACARDSESGTTVAEDCKPKYDVDTVEDGVLTVGATDLPPFSAIDGAIPTEVDGDIVKEFAKAACLSVVAKPFTYSNAIPALQEDRVDIVIGAWNRTADRAEVVELSDPLYLDLMGLISKDGVTSISDLESRTVGTPDGYLWVNDMKSLLGDDLRLYPTNVDVANDLKAGRIDVAADSYGAAVELFKGTDYEVTVAESDDRVAASTEPAQVGFPINKGNTGLLEAVNEFIGDAHTDGTIAEILENYGLDPAAADTGEPRLIQ
jgi:polar amino acid transport system substrate-binding protein